ncbi:NAD-binding protein [Halosegnis marinus]|uniref:NAD-binding protein n=1 Tax=Halosegnis marinus TaxID=3034023 RepID=A0ABD5ZML1_9EURY|nr:NAD-binding protein [Halosegnis sp. DT85]
MTHDTLVLGGGPLGLALAAALAERDPSVAFVDGAAMATRARAAGLTAHESTLETAASAVDAPVETVVVATDSDARNLLLAAAAPRELGADTVVALLNDPDRRAAFDDAGIETVCVSEAVARATAESVVLDAALPSTEATEAAEGRERTRLRG